MPNIEITPAHSDEIPKLHHYITEALGPGIATIPTVRAVHALQGFSVWRVSDANGKTSGAFAILYLNEKGLIAVENQTFDASDPQLDCLARTPEEVKAIFAWCVVLRGKAKAAILKAATWIDLCGWNDHPIFTNPITPHGERLARAMGFTPLAPNTPLHAVY